MFFWPCSGYSYLICDHMRAVHLYVSALENSCPLMAFPCTSYKAFLAGHCLDCFNPFLLSCPRIGKCYPFGFLWQLGESSSLVTSLSPDLLWLRSLHKCGKENLSNESINLFPPRRWHLAFRALPLTLYTIAWCHTCSAHSPHTHTHTQTHRHTHTHTAPGLQVQPQDAF